MLLRSVVKKTISILLVFAVSLGTVYASGGLEQESKEDAGEIVYDTRPVILVSGFGATTLSLCNEDGSENPVFPPQSDEFTAALDGQILPLCVGLIRLLTIKKADTLVDCICTIVSRIAEPISMNADGTSKYDIVPVVRGAKNTSLSAFKENDMLNYIPYTGSEFLDMEMIGDIIGDDRVFNFTYDWRMSHIDSAVRFKDYIDEVLVLTGADKVNVYAISQGSLLVGEYLYKYAGEEKVNNVVFDTPVLTGSDLLTDLFSPDELSINYETVLDIVEEILHIETNLSSIVSVIPADTLNFVCDYGMKELIAPKIISAIGFWDMVPFSELERLENQWLDEDENAAVILKTEQIHNGFMSNVTETFENAERYGIKVSIKSCSGIPLASGTFDNSDGIVNMKYSCGAVCSDYSERFSDSYTQIKPGNYSVSPDRTVDLSNAFYPERTWVINNHYHGQVEWDENSLKLVLMLLMTDSIKDAYSSYEFPQFMEAAAPNNDLAAYFDSTNCLFLPFSDGLLCGDSVTIKNVSEKSCMFIKDIAFDKGSINISDKLPVMLRAGESVSIKICKTETIDSLNGSRLYDNIRLTYISMDNPFKTLIKQFGITILNDYAGVIVC